MISWAAEAIACAPDPQTRLTVMAGALSRNPALMAAWRAGFIFAPAWTTCPMTTLSILSAPTPARLSVSAMATLPSAGAFMSLSAPP